MPIPKPHPNENQDDFMDRCMGDNVMVDDYPDSKQRFAICQQQWKDKDKKSMKSLRELRFLPFEGWEWREDDGKPPRLEGYASVFDQEAEIFGMWREKVAPGAFKKTIAENDIRALWNHNTDYPLGRNKAKTLELTEDKKGLKSIIYPPDTQAGRDAVTSIKRGDVTQMSIAFQTVKQEWFTPEDKKTLPLRTIREMKLFEVSPVTFPAFDQTEIQARSGIIIPDGDLDPLELGRRILRCAERGMILSKEQRQIIVTAMELYQSFLSEPDDHSESPESEPDAEGENIHSQEPGFSFDSVFYSAVERERRLNLIFQSLNMEK